MTLPRERWQQAQNRIGKAAMARNRKEPETNGQLEAAGLSRGVGGLLIVLSFLRWPATAMLASPAWGLADYRWLLIPAVQAGAEAMFWIGVWLVGRGPLRAALARISRKWRIRAALARSIRM